MTALFSTSGLFKTVECFATFTCLVLHRIGNRGSQVWFGTTDFEMGYKETRSEVDAEIIGCGILTCMCIVSLTYNSVFALSGPPTIANLNISRNSQQVAASMGVMCIFTALIYLADFFYLLCQRSKFLDQ